MVADPADPAVERTRVLVNEFANPAQDRDVRLLEQIRRPDLAAPVNADLPAGEAEQARVMGSQELFQCCDVSVGGLLREKAEYDGAAELLREARGISRVVLGDAHTDMKRSANGSSLALRLLST